MNHPPDPAPTLRLRLLATTDLHAHLLPWDYYRDQPQADHGLALVATLLAKARAEVANCLYFDNGDLIEGNPLAEYALHAAGMGVQALHPMIAALNTLGCDAATLGNHEFSYGPAFLRTVLKGASYPVVCANILEANGAPLVPPWVLLKRMVADDAGQSHPLQIGVFGLTPPQVLDWERAVLAGALQARGMVAAAKQAAVALRAAGADIVVCLAHTGIGDADLASENVGAQLAHVAGIDALILGHEHRLFPAPDQTGLLGGLPAVMPGAFGSHLGVIDLVLQREQRTWRVASATAACRPVAMRGPFGEAVAQVAEDKAMAALANDSHAGTRHWMTRQVGQTPVALHSFFAVAQPTVMQALIAEAQAAHLAEMLVGTPWQGLAVLSAVAPFKTGGRGGPAYFTHVAAGPVLLRHAADLYVHPNRFAAIAITGAGLREWLERAASAYAQVEQGVQDQPLLDPRFPATCLEMIAGLSYEIDLSAPARYDAPTGRLIGGAGRIRQLHVDGKALADDRLFALATNSHRLGVLQHIMGAGACEVIADGTGSLGSRDVMVRHLARAHTATLPAPMAWAFRPLPGTSVTLDTAPAALQHLNDIAGFTPQNLGLTEAGFLRFRLHL